MRYDRATIKDDRSGNGVKVVFLVQEARHKGRIRIKSTFGLGITDLARS